MILYKSVPNKNIYATGSLEEFSLTCGKPINDFATHEVYHFD